MNKPPAFQLYANNFLTGTADFTPEEVGAYIRLLCYQWDRGSLPSDIKKLKNLAGCTEDALASIMHKFEPSGEGTIQNSKLEKVRRAQEDFRKSRSENALRGWEGEKAVKRKDALASKVHKLRRCKKDALQSSVLNSNTSPNPFGDGVEEGKLPFDSPEFEAAVRDWKIYRKEIKKPLTPSMLASQFNHFSEIGEKRSIAGIRNSIFKGWQGFKEPEEDRRNGQPQGAGYAI